MRNVKREMALVLCSALILSFIPSTLIAAPAVGTPSAVPASLVAGQATTVTVMSSVTGDSTNPSHPGGC